MNRLDAVVESCGPRDSHAWLRVGSGRLAARRWPGARRGGRITVHLRPEDVVLAAAHPGRVSARNVLPGHVRSLRRVPEGLYVTIHVGFPLVAMITRAAAEELRLRRGTPVFAIVKATAIVPEVEVSPEFVLSVAGPAGILDERHLNLLRAIDRSGSMSAAARELGVTYRTAWLWVRAMNRAWKKTLVARLRGGIGGGGAALTPAARALLETIERAEARLAAPPRYGAPGRRRAVPRGARRGSPGRRG
jgi:molybdate transport repressor ModE-like protein/molybdopterin-binding protein